MSCLGVHFALTEKEVAHLRSLVDEQARLEHLQEVIEEHYLTHEKQFAAESDKAWDAMHRTLADGQLSWDGGTYPLNHTILAGELLYTKPDYIMSLKSPAQVRDIAAALLAVAEVDFRQRYFAIDARSYGSAASAEDFGYTWEWFQGVRELYTRAAQEGRFVLFTADQGHLIHRRSQPPLASRAGVGSLPGR
jgi:hypothetical protein